MKQRLVNWLLKNLLNAIVLNDVLLVEKGVIYLNKKPITDEELRQLISEAKAIESTRLWSILNETLKNDAVDRGWNKSTTLDQMNTGKTIFYTLDLQSQIIKLIRSREKIST